MTIMGWAALGACVAVLLSLALITKD